MTAPESKGYWVYIAELENGQLYIGLTADIKRRTVEHQQGKPGTRTTFISRAIGIIHKEWFPDAPSARKREKQIKGWTRAKKLALANGDFQTLKALSKSRSRR